MKAKLKGFWAATERVRATLLCTLIAAIQLFAGWMSWPHWIAAAFLFGAGWITSMGMMVWKVPQADVDRAVEEEEVRKAVRREKEAVHRVAAQEGFRPDNEEDRPTKTMLH